MLNLKILKYILIAHLVLIIKCSLGQNVTEQIPQNETLATNITKDVEPPLDMDLEQPFNYSIKVDNHLYYNSTLHLDSTVAKQYWIDFDTTTGVILHDMLSDSYRRAASVNLTFEFPFYGHYLNNVTIATGGFLYMGVYMHTWLAATQYAAPLMGNFDTTKNHSIIQYYDNGTVFTVEWKDVILRDKPEVGEFTFQVSLFKNGDINFVYQKVPIPVTAINNYSHPVKVGLADAYTVDKHFFFVKRKTIYEYNKIDAMNVGISNNTAILFKALPTCLLYKNCESCISANIDFECSWCTAAGRCSDGLDRHRQDWIEKNCVHALDKKTCPVITSTLNPPTTANISMTSTVISTASSTPSTSTSTESFQVDPQAHKAVPEASSGGISTGGILTLIVVFIALIMFGALLIHAYRNPQSDAGQFLIRYRPSQWRISRGQARYTAASIHM